MAVDNAEKRKSISGLHLPIAGAGVTPNALKDAEWRAQVAWLYSGIAIEAPGAAIPGVYKYRNALDEWQIIWFGVSYVHGALLTGSEHITLHYHNTKKIVRITAADSPYTVTTANHVIFCDTDAGAIVVNLAAGIDGSEVRITNTGSSGNNVDATPDGTEQLYGGGAGVPFTIYDAESITINFETTENWW